MRAMVLEATRTPLVMRERPTPEPKQGEILVEIAACGVCRTDLHVVDGELQHPNLPIVPGQEIVGRIAAIGSGVAGFAAGDRVGVPWLCFTCGVGAYCSAGQENLCDRPLFTGYTRDGGYATHTLAWHPLRWSTTGRRPILRRERPPKQMQSDWKNWMGKHAGIFADKGAGVGKTRRVTAQGSAAGRNDIMLYAIVQAESREAASKMFEDHPHLGIPQSSIEIMEIHALPGTF